VDTVFLIVDGNVSEAEAAATLLGRAAKGAEILTAGSGRAALALLKERQLRPSLVFLEYSLPDMNGIEFLGAMRTVPWLAPAPAVMLSSTTTDRVVTDCFRLGACGFLTKPANLMDLREAVQDFARLTVRLAEAPRLPFEDSRRSAA
jgi:CheY-like chemotaxis protein